MADVIIKTGKEQMPLQKVFRLLLLNEEKNRVFTNIGTNQDVAKEAAKINITNHLYFAAPEMASKSVLSKELKARERFYKKLEENPAGAMQENYIDADN